MNLIILSIRKFPHDFHFANFLFLNYWRVFEFASVYTNVVYEAYIKSLLVRS